MTCLINVLAIIAKKRPQIPSRKANPIPMQESNVVICHECDLICQDTVLGAGGAAYCPRCKAKLFTNSGAKLDQALALSISGAMLFLIMNAFPLMAINLQQTTHQTTMFEATLAMWDKDMHVLAMLVFLTTIIAPALHISLEILVLCLIKFGDATRALALPTLLLRKLRPWNMVEVFMLGLLVSLVKLRDIADIIIGPAFWSCAFLILITAILGSMLTPRNIWCWTHDGSAHA